MCGVIGLLYEEPRSDLGRIASQLLRTLEYRGYDSTGGAFQGEGLEVRLRKGVGAPSAMVEKLGIVSESGQLFCGQVRWATFGAVDEANAQPHLVRCKTFLYGAHNGNITNCDELKAWLTAEGHAVLSDNDGEMVVHTVEHFFAAGLGGAPEGLPRVLIPIYEASLYDLLRAYGEGRARKEGGILRIEATELYSMEDALQRLSRLLGRMPDWRALSSFLPAGLLPGIVRRSAVAATFTASLELVRSGKLQIRHGDPLSPRDGLRLPPFQQLEIAWHLASFPLVR